MTLDELVLSVIGYQTAWGQVVRGVLEVDAPDVWARVKLGVVEDMIRRCWAETFSQVQVGRPVWVRGMGTFIVRVKRPEKTIGRNPETGAALKYQGHVRANMALSPLDASEMMVCLHGRGGWVSAGWQRLGKEVGQTDLERVENAMAVYDAMVKVIQATIQAGGIVVIPGIGMWGAGWAAPSRGRHPVTGEWVDRGAKRVAKFVPSGSGMPPWAKLDFRFNPAFIGA